KRSPAIRPSRNGITNCKRKPDGPISRRIIEKLPAVDALIPRLGDHERAVFRPVAVLALHFEIERAPPEPIIPFRSRAPALGFSKRQIFKQAGGMERRQRFL